MIVTTLRPPCKPDWPLAVAALPEPLPLILVQAASWPRTRLTWDSDLTLLSLDLWRICGFLWWGMTELPEHEMPNRLPLVCEGFQDKSDGTAYPFMSPNLAVDVEAPFLPQAMGMLLGGYLTFTGHIGRMLIKNGQATTGCYITPQLRVKQNGSAMEGHWWSRIIRGPVDQLAVPRRMTRYLA